METRRKAVFLKTGLTSHTCCVSRTGCWTCGSCWTVTECGWEDEARMDGSWRSCSKVLVFIAGGASWVFCPWSKLRRYWVVAFWLSVVTVTVWLELNTPASCFTWTWGWNTERTDCSCCWVAAFERNSAKLNDVWSSSVFIDSGGVIGGERMICDGSVLTFTPTVVLACSEFGSAAAPQR